MNRRRSTPAPTRRARGDRGATLIFALAVMLAMSAIIGGLLTFVSTSNRTAIVLTERRNREYAADAGIEQAIRAVQVGPQNGLLGNGCNAAGSPFTPTPATINGYAIRVDCTGAALPVLDGLGRVVIQRNVLFVACVDTGAACTDATAIIRAKVNFATNAAGAVIGSFVQSWSVK